ncbi:alpha/beta hydrolase [Kribbella sp. NPDC026611]|uniref:alpha/beta fold hydrolase n=1 Tax=Kribbella sp. NPDC026611 TaxID=3154911 RepID=UPI003400BC2E
MDDVVQVGSRELRYSIYGPADGVPVLSFGGSPSTRWKRPDAVRAVEECGVRLVTPDRPGYGGSTRQPGRTVASAAVDAAAVANALSWDRFTVTGGSGGGPHALACAALLGDLPAAQRSPVTAHRPATTPPRWPACTQPSSQASKAGKTTTWRLLSPGDLS